MSVIVSPRTIRLTILAATLSVGCLNAEKPKPSPNKMSNDLWLTFVRIPGGTFVMGDDDGPGASPEHRVTLSPFWIMREEVTNRQYETFRKHRRSEFSPGPDYPVDAILRKDVLDFAAWLSKRDGRRYGLPSEAQWEYAARAGREGTKFPWGDRTDLEKALSGGLMARPVGSYPPNAFGLYDMIGNVGEMVHESWYEYGKDPLIDPRGSDADESRIVRGMGVGIDMPWVWLRTFHAGDMPIPGRGFRLVVLESPPKRKLKPKG